MANIKASTQKFTEIADIKEGIVIFAGGNACLVVEVTATNFALLSKEEQDTKVYSYAALLNSLSFPIQILVRNKKVDISLYIRLLDQEAKKTPNEKLATHIKLYREFVQELVKVNTVLDKKFYIILSYNYLEKGVAGAASVSGAAKSDSFFEAARKALHLKAESLHAQLARLGLPAKTLEKEELIKLYYGIYNEDLSETSQIADDLKAALIKSA